jgi:hypothetical protein
MSSRVPRGTLLQIPLVRETYGRSFLASVVVHAAAVVVLVFAPYLLPRPGVITLGSGP